MKIFSVQMQNQSWTPNVLLKGLCLISLGTKSFNMAHA